MGSKTPKRNQVLVQPMNKRCSRELDTGSLSKQKEQKAKHSQLRQAEEAVCEFRHVT